LARAVKFCTLAWYLLKYHVGIVHNGKTTLDKEWNDETCWT